MNKNALLIIFVSILLGLSINSFFYFMNAHSFPENEFMSTGEEVYCLFGVIVSAIMISIVSILIIKISKINKYVLNAKGEQNGS